MEQVVDEGVVALPGEIRACRTGTGPTFSVKGFVDHHMLARRERLGRQGVMCCVRGRQVDGRKTQPEDRCDQRRVEGRAGVAETDAR